jgi:hypothetical protein
MQHLKETEVRPTRRFEVPKMHKNYNFRSLNNGPTYFALQSYFIFRKVLRKQILHIFLISITARFLKLWYASQCSVVHEHSKKKSKTKNKNGFPSINAGTYEI